MLDFLEIWGSDISGLTEDEVLLFSPNEYESGLANTIAVVANGRYIYTQLPAAVDRHSEKLKISGFPRHIYVLFWKKHIVALGQAKND